MTDMPFFSQPVSRSMSAGATASGADASILYYFPILPFAGDDE